MNAQEFAAIEASHFHTFTKELSDAVAIIRKTAKIGMALCQKENAILESIKRDNIAKSAIAQDVKLLSRQIGDTGYRLKELVKQLNTGTLNAKNKKRIAILESEYEKNPTDEKFDIWMELVNACGKFLLSQHDADILRRDIKHTARELSNLKFRMSLCLDKPANYKIDDSALKIKYAALLDCRQSIHDISRELNLCIWEHQLIIENNTDMIKKIKNDRKSQAGRLAKRQNDIKQAKLRDSTSNNNKPHPLANIQNNWQPIAKTKTIVKVPRPKRYSGV